ncbi:MAG: class I SAM-dependent methyltransferase family protein, partial [Candidatus Bathyarchaeota archaeon]
TTPVKDEFRTRELTWIGGNETTETIHRENNCQLRVDLSKTYFSSRLQFERMRIAGLVKFGEVIVNMFSGVGSFSIVVAKFARPSKVYSIDINPYAVKYLTKNVELNRVEGTVVPILGDAREIIDSSLLNTADRVLMPLPEKVFDYLGVAISALGKNGGYIHPYDFVHAIKNEDPLSKFVNKLTEKLDVFNVSFSFSGGRVVRSVGPNWHQVVLDIRVLKY